MERQLVVSVVGALVAWYLIEQIKKLRAPAATADPVSGIASSEQNSEIMV